MATLRFSQIRTTPGKTLQYIANEEKFLSSQVHDIHKVLNYMGEPDSVMRVFSFGHHCSANPAFAEKQMETNRQRYYASKSGGVQGLKKGRNELVGLHFFLSYTEADNPSQAVMDDILARIADYPKLRDFPIFGAHHFDRQHNHTHFFVSQYSAEGIPRKLGLCHKEYNDIRKYINRICVEHGLSIIDLAALRWKDPEYSAWIDDVIAAGKVTVHPEKEEHKKNPKQKIPTRNLYYKWKRQGEEQAEEAAKLLTEAQRQKCGFESKYFYTPDGNPDKRWYVTGDPKHRFYVVPLVSKDGVRRSQLELTVRFVAAVVATEGNYIQSHNPCAYDILMSKTDWRLQRLYDAMQTAIEMNIEKPADVPNKIAFVGKQMNALKREKSRHERNIEKQREILMAYEKFNRVRSFVEGVYEPEPAVLSEYKSAYAILVQNQILTAEAYEGLHRHYDFEKQKIYDYEKRLPELNKQYRALKKIEAITSDPVGMLNEIYGYSVMDKVRARREDGVDRAIKEARARVSNSGRSCDMEKEVCTQNRGG